LCRHRQSNPRHCKTTGWIPIVSSSTTLWLVITALALLAIVRRRARNRAIEKQWMEEEKNAGDDEAS
jgi:hypothetical protein